MINLSLGRDNRNAFHVIIWKNRSQYREKKRDWSMEFYLAFRINKPKSKPRVIVLFFTCFWCIILIKNNIDINFESGVDRF